MRFILLLTLSVHFLMIRAQQPVENDSLPFDVQKQSIIYQSAVRYSDPLIARMALYNFLAYNPSNTAILDSLALSYTNAGMVASAAIVAQDVLSLNPKDMLATEIAAVSFERLGLKDKSLSYYEVLYLNKQELMTLYKMAFLQMELKRYTEAQTSTDIIINDTTSVHELLLFKDAEQNQQSVPLNAEALRLKALVAQDQEKIEEAIGYLTRSLAISPDFYVAQVQLKTLQDKEK